MGENRAIAVAGDGTTAVVVAACLALVGHRVLSVGTHQIDLRDHDAVPNPPFEAGLADLLQAQQRTGRLAFGDDIPTAVREADVTFLCTEDRSRAEDSDAESLATSVRSIGEAAHRGHVVVVTTNLAIGNGTWPGPMIEDSFAGNGNRPSLVSYPGFMREGRAVSDFLSPEHVVIGSDNPRALDRVTDLLRPILNQSHAQGDPKRKPDVIRTDLATAEGIKRAVSNNIARAAADVRWRIATPQTPELGNVELEPIGNGARPPTAPQQAFEQTGTEADDLPNWKRPQRRRDRIASPTVTVVIPTLNEAANLPHVLRRLPESIDEVVIVDGRSTDATVDVARRLLPDCLVVLEERPGKGVALRSGFEAATGDIVVMLDADGSTDPREIPAFVGLLVSGADFVKGSRFIQGGGTDDMEYHRKLGNRILTMLVNIGFGGRYSDLCYGYIGMWRNAVPAMDLNADGFEIETLMGIRALRAGLEIAEVPSFECNRIHGTSNLHAVRDGLRILRTIIRERLRPFRPPVTSLPIDIESNAALGGRPSSAARDAELLRY